MLRNACMHEYAQLIFSPESNEFTERTLELEVLQAELHVTWVTNAASCSIRIQYRVSGFGLSVNCVA